MKEKRPKYLPFKDPTTKRVLLACQERQRGIDKLIRQCDRRYRKSDLPASCNHRFTILVNDLPPPEPILKDLESSSIMEIVSESVAQLNLSLSQATSPVFLHLLNRCMNLGFQFKENHPHSTVIQMQSLSFSRKTVREAIIRFAGKARAESLERAKNLGFVSVAIDGGTLVHKKLFFVTLQNSNAGVPPFYYSSAETRSWHTSNYAAFGKKLVEDVSTAPH
jgi:hypothetical protein